MIICTYKGVGATTLVQKESNKYSELELFKNNSVVNLGKIKLFSDIGAIIIISASNAKEMLKIKELVESDDTLDVLFIFPDVTLHKEWSERFKDTRHFYKKEFSKLSNAFSNYKNVFKINTTEYVLKEIIDEHYEKNIELHEKKTSKYKFISGVTREENKKVTMFTDNICTIIQELDNSREYYLEVDIRSADDLHKVLSYYIDENISIDSVIDAEIKFIVSNKYLSNIHDKLYQLYTFNVYIQKK